MRLIIVLGAIYALSQAAAAESGDCTSIADAAGKLACYNNEAPPAPRRPTATRPPAAARPAASTNEGTKYIDHIGEEDAIVNARMRNICRGC